MLGSSPCCWYLMKPYEYFAHLDSMCWDYRVKKHVEKQ
jgi:hypothetical protein